MKRILFVFCLIGTIIGINSCSNEFDLIEEWKDIPVVYALMSRQDSAHYIRIEKAFSDPKVSGAEIARIPDSLYYENIKVELEHGDSGERFVMNRVDGRLEGYPRAEGPFATSPNYLYKIHSNDINLEEDQEYRLIVTNGASDQIITEATTCIVGDYTPVNAQPSNPINFKYNSPVSISWRSDEVCAYFYDVRLVIHYEEQNPDNINEFLEKKIEWIVERNLEREGESARSNIRLVGADFYKFLQSAIPNDQVLLRKFSSIDIIVDAGGLDLFEYINIGQANTGITSSQVIPSYTNLSNGVGVFSSRNRMISTDYNISGESRDSLRDGIYTRELNFQ